MSRELQVVKSNHIISASYRLSVAEQRVILSCIAQLRRDEQVTDDVLYSVTGADIVDLCGSDPSQAYRDLAAAAERLYDRRVVIMMEPNGTSRHPRKRLTRWVQTVDYIPGEGRVELRFGKDILPFLTGLTEQFTRYQLSDVARMTSAHAIRLFEMLSQYVRIGQREISLEELRDWFQLDGKYPAIKDLKRWVIDPAVEQVNQLSPLRVAWTQRKTGRKVTHLLFTFSSKAGAKALPEAEQVPFQREPTGEPEPRKPRRGATLNPSTYRQAGDADADLKRALSDAEIASRARPGETWDQVCARLGVRRSR